MADNLDFTPPRALDMNADGVAGAEAFFYESGTTTPVTVYKDTAGNTEHATPVVADALGIFPPIYSLAGTPIKAIVQSADAVVLPGYPVDPVRRISTANSSAASVTFTPTASVAATDVQAAIEDVKESSIPADDLIASSDLTVSPTNPLRRDAAKTYIDGLLPTIVTTTATVFPSTGGAITVAHGLAALPDMMTTYLQNRVAVDGYDVGDRVAIASGGRTSAGISTFIDGTNVGLSRSGDIYYATKSGSGFVTYDGTNWDVVFVLVKFN